MKERSPDQRSAEKDSSLPWVFFTGLCMGAADVVPGVSGGTMAFIMGVYQHLIDAIKSVDAHFAQLLTKLDIKRAFEHINGTFLLALGSGIVVAVLVLSGGVEWALHNQRTLLFAFFFGLVVASIVSLGSKISWGSSQLAWFVVGAIAAWLLVGILAKPTPNEPWMAFVAGGIGITAMILPGISGSFILLILGQYGNIISAINDLKGGDLGALGTLVPFGLGMVIGIMLFSRVLSWLLHRYYFATVAVMTGFIAGSLRKIWPFKGDVIQSLREERRGDRDPRQCLAGYLCTGVLAGDRSGAGWLRLHHGSRPHPLERESDRFAGDRQAPRLTPLKKRVKLAIGKGGASAHGSAEMPSGVLP